MTKIKIDLNADLGESFGAYTIGDDAAMMEIITSANIACGFHGGDPVVMARTIAMAKAAGVGIGAHPGFDDLRGFGRRKIIMREMGDIEKMLIYQLGAITGMAQAAGASIGHYKIHGALNNMAAEDKSIARATAAAMKAIAPHLVFVVPPRSAMETEGERLGLTLAREIFADRGYDDEGMLIPRGEPGAMIEDAEAAAERITGFVMDGAITSNAGKRIAMPMDTICVHGDTPGAVALARRVRERLEEAGVMVEGMGNN